MHKLQRGLLFIHNCTQGIISRYKKHNINGLENTTSLTPHLMRKCPSIMLAIVGQLLASNLRISKKIIVEDSCMVILL